MSPLWNTKASLRLLFHPGIRINTTEHVLSLNITSQKAGFLIPKTHHFVHIIGVKTFSCLYFEKTYKFFSSESLELSIGIEKWLRSERDLNWWCFKLQDVEKSLWDSHHLNDYSSLLFQVLLELLSLPWLKRLMWVKLRSWLVLYKAPPPPCLSGSR